MLYIKKKKPQHFLQHNYKTRVWINYFVAIFPTPFRMKECCFFLLLLLLFFCFVLISHYTKHQLFMRFFFSFTGTLEKPLWVPYSILSKVTFSEKKIPKYEVTCKISCDQIIPNEHSIYHPCDHTQWTVCMCWSYT